MNLTDKQKKGLIVTLFIGAVGLIVIAYFHFMIGRGMINNYTRQSEDARKEIAELGDQLQSIKDLMGQKDEIESQAAMIRKVTRRLPGSPDAPGFLGALVTSLGTTGIFQEEVRPDRNISRALYTEIPYRVKAHGYYHAFGQFLTLIEQNPDRFMRIKSLKLSNNPDRPSVHPIDMEIVTFMFNR
jgi:Tfp pilus assembly protein PilO